MLAESLSHTRRSVLAPTAVAGAVGISALASPDALGAPSRAAPAQDQADVADRAMPSGNDGFSFGPFRLFPARLLLLEADKPVRLGNRALDILIVLVERRGEVISKEDLIARVWPNTFVEEGNLRVHMAALRRVLGDDQAGNRFIATVPGRGYSFVSPVSIVQDSARPLPAATTVEGVHNLPRPLTRMAGHADAVEPLAAQLSHRHFNTLVGPGLIDKITVALAVAERLIESLEERAPLIGLAPLANPRGVPSTLESSPGVDVIFGQPNPRSSSLTQGKAHAARARQLRARRRSNSRAGLRAAQGHFGHPRPGTRAPLRPAY
jgi:DNA-binding winged helix-turn-helix (wHTH) protein